MSKSKTTYSQKFRKEWLKVPAFTKWLCELPNDSSKAHCKFCRCDILAKYSLLTSHCETKKHKLSTPCHSASLTNYIVKKDDKTATLEANLAMYICCHSAFNSCDHLVDLCKNTISDSETVNKVKMHRTKCRNIVKNVIAPYFNEDLLSDLGQGKFSLLLDESNDIAINKLLGIIIIYYSNNHKKVVHTYLNLVLLEKCDADGIVNAIKTELAENKLNMKNLLAIGTDNASVMVGINNGVFKKLKDEIPGLLLFRCVCHSIQLSVSHACAASLPRNLEFLVSETYKWFSQSSVRQISYNQLFLAINNKEPLKILNSCATRWLSIEPAISRILSQWIELQTHFQIASVNERCYTAQLLSDMYCDPQNELFILFLHPILKHVQEVNKLFESNTVDKTQLLSDLSHLIRSIANMLVLPTSRIDFLDPNSNIEEFLDPNPQLGYRFEKRLTELRISKKIQASQETDIRKRAQFFLLCLYKELHNCMPENLNILKNIELFSVKNTLSHIKNPIIPLLESFHLDEEIKSSIEIQYNSIHLVKWTNIETTEGFWSEVFAYRDASGGNPFKEIAEFAISLLILPNSNAEVERLFSSMNIVKNKLRNKMQLPMLSAILTIKYGLKRHNKCCKNFELPKDVINKIGTMKSYDLNKDPERPEEVLLSAFPNYDDIFLEV